MGTASWLLLGRLRRAVKKIKFLLNFNNIINRWHLASMIGASTSKSLRLMSFSDRPGLGVCADDDADTTYHDSSSSSRGRGGFLSRSTSYSSEDNDIDKRAEMFIANFHRQLQIERQVSLELRHCRGNSLQSITPP